ncbi:DUF411 domain-containing protein [Roseobacter sp.]|uniref:DUF411 domain-containing protein n=1 Tax=Roseobacter sp. TaxID=1907202 RepID=UPI00385DE9FD
MKPIKPLLAFKSNTALALGIASLGWACLAQADKHASMAGYGTIHVTKSPACGCCSACVSLADEESHDIQTTEREDVTRVKLHSDIPSNMWACISAQIDSYVVDCNVSFEAVAKLLEERPEIKCIAVPGMPGGTAGMRNDATTQFDVIAFAGIGGDGEVFYQAVL